MPLKAFEPGREQGQGLVLHSQDPAGIGRGIKAGNCVHAPRRW